MAVSRRRFAQLAGGALASLTLGQGCGVDPFFAQGGQGRLRVRPKAGVKTTASAITPLGVDAGRDGVLFVPSASPAGPLPLLVLMHGAGGRADRMLARFGDIPNQAGVAVLSVDSRGSTWDGIRGGFGVDVAFLDRALENVFTRVAVDPARLAIGGFSDGATYALSLGLMNGDLFPKIVAFSPGFEIPGDPAGKPSVFISHGTADEILPIDRCSRVIVPRLRARGYAVTFREFAGGHEMPASIATEGLSWITGPVRAL